MDNKKLADLFETLAVCINRLDKSTEDMESRAAEQEKQSKRKFYATIIWAAVAIYAIYRVMNFVGEYDFEVAGAGVIVDPNSIYIGGNNTDNDKQLFLNSGSNTTITLPTELINDNRSK